MFLTFSLSLIYMKLREFTTSVKHGEIKLLMLISNSSEFMQTSVCFSCTFLLLLYRRKTTANQNFICLYDLNIYSKT